MILCSNGFGADEGGAGERQRGEREGGRRWEVLFDGGSTDKWRGFRRDEFPSKGWIVEEGVLKTNPKGEVVDIITREKFDNFELQLEWRVTPAGNSGIMFHVTEESGEPWHTGPEFQILDDERHADGKDPKTSAGALYGLIAPSEKAAKPVGEWNRVRLVVRGNRAQYFLNGKRVVHVTLGSPELRELVAASKFKDFPKFARTGEGHILLQHHTDEVWFRDVRVRRIRARAQE